MRGAASSATSSETLEYFLRSERVRHALQRHKVTPVAIISKYRVPTRLAGPVVESHIFDLCMFVT